MRGAHQRSLWGYQMGRSGVDRGAWVVVRKSLSAGPQGRALRVWGHGPRCRAVFEGKAAAVCAGALAAGAHTAHLVQPLG